MAAIIGAALLLHVLTAGLRRQDRGAAQRLDPREEARFRKAVGLTYGPTLSSRQGEAIAHFEKLVAQQVNLPSDPRFAQTYLYLGRLHAQRGDAARARQIWQEGLARHPKDAE